MLKNVKAISPVVATSLLLVVAVIAVVGFQSWFSEFSSFVLVGVEKDSSLGNINTNIETIVGSNLYINNGDESNISIKDIKVNGMSCNISKSIASGINIINLSSCMSNHSSNTPEILVLTDAGIFEKSFYIEKSMDFNSEEILNSVVCNSEGVYGFHGGIGTIADPWQICNCSQLQDINLALSDNYSLVQDINCDISPYNAGTGFTPISVFSGKINGNGFSISNLYINTPGSGRVGLFGETNGVNTEINNINLLNVNVTGDDYVGGLIGYSYFGIVDNSYVTGDVLGVGEGSVGGLIGQTNKVYINNSYSSGNVDGGVSVGGLIGSNLYSNVDNSYSFSNVFGSSVHIGGLIGYNSRSANITYSYATGNVSSGGNDKVGGLIGRNNEFSTVNNSYATGDVDGDNMVGGLIGYKHYGIIDNSYATGNVFGSDGVGGLVGRSYRDGFVDNSYATGDVFGDSEVGGLFGYNYNVINNTYATGNVLGSNRVGGFVGFNYGNGEISNSYTIGNVNGSDQVGGFVGYNYGSISFSYASGELNGYGIEDIGGFSGYSSEGTFDNLYWNNMTNNPDETGLSAGLVNVIDNDEAYFYNNLNQPLSSWSSLIWEYDGSNHPTLK